MSLSNHDITYTPLSGNRLRCNWNGVVIKRHQRNAAANRYWSELHPNEVPNLPVEVDAPKAYRVESAAISRDGNGVNCPYCKMKKWSSYEKPLVSGKMRCNYCHKEFKATANSPELATTKWKMTHGPTYGAANCPHCLHTNEFRYRGKTQCDECKREFIAVE